MGGLDTGRSVRSMGGATFGCVLTVGEDVRGWFVGIFVGFRTGSIGAAVGSGPTAGVDVDVPVFVPPESLCVPSANIADFDCRFFLTASRTDKAMIRIQTTRMAASR